MPYVEFARALLLRVTTFTNNFVMMMTMML